MGAQEKKDGQQEAQAMIVGPMGQGLNDVARRGYVKLEYDADLFDDERSQKRMESALETMAPREVKLEPQLGSKAGKK